MIPMRRGGCARVGALIASSILWLACGGGESVDRPNVVLIVADDLSWTDPGFMGNPAFETPHIDELASQGLVFTDAYSNAPNCAPSRTSLVSGQHPVRHGILTVGSRPAVELVPVRNRRDFGPEVATLGSLFADAGYTTGIFGKWHVAGGKDAGPYGFDVTVTRESLGFGKKRHARRNEADEPEYLVDRLTDEAVRFIDDNRDRPFLLFLSHYAVHQPLEAPPGEVERFRRKLGTTHPELALYAAMLAGLDDSVGRITSELDRLGLEDRTAVVFWSDNGGSVVTSQGGLKGFKGTLYEGGIRVPLVVRWPASGIAGSRTGVPVIGMDLLPTLLELAGIAPPAGQEMDGVSLMPLLSGSTNLPRDALFWHVPAYTLVTAPAAAVRMGPWKLIERFEDGALELYNLAEDPRESRDLAADEPERVERMHETMLEWRSRIGARVPRQPDRDGTPPLDG